MSLTEAQKKWLRTQQPDKIWHLVQSGSAPDIEELRSFAREDAAFSTRWKVVEDHFNLQAEDKEYEYIRQQVQELLNNQAATPSREIIETLEAYDRSFGGNENIPDEHIDSINRWRADFGQRRAAFVMKKWSELFDHRGRVIDIDALTEFCLKHGTEACVAELAEEALWQAATAGADMLEGARAYRAVYPRGKHNSDYLRMEFEAVVDEDGAALSPELMLDFRRRFSAEEDYSIRVDDALWQWAMKQDDVVAAANIYNQLTHSLGRHSSGVGRLNTLFTEWQEVDKDDIDDIIAFKQRYGDVPFEKKVAQALRAAKAGVVTLMKDDPVAFNSADIREFINMGIFTRQELQDIFDDTDGHIVTRILDADRLTSGIKFPSPDEHAITSGFDSTDIVLFGIPRCGKTCLLMGLLHNERLDFVSDDWSGQCAQALREYADVGVAPGYTVEGFVSVTKCKARRNDRNTWIDFNLVDMAGEDFVKKIVQVHAGAQSNSSFADMGTGAAELLTNRREKVLFIMVDPTLKDRDAATQKKVVKKLIDILQNKVNRDIVSRVRAIHFIVTKADTLQEPRLDNARAVIHSCLGATAREQLIKFCRENGINTASDAEANGRPRVFCFSLGTFYPANTFEYNAADSDIILSLIADYVTALNRGRSRLLDLITKPIF